MNAHREAEEWIDVAKLVPWKDNPRINDASADHLVPVIREFGFLDALIVRRGTMELIAGHTRLKAAKIIGLEQVPVIWMDLDDDASKRLALLHNKSAERAEWDPLKLLDLVDDGLDLLTAGFSEVEFDELLGLGEKKEKAESAGPMVTKTEDHVNLPRRLSISMFLFCDDADELEELLMFNALPGEGRAETVIRALTLLKADS